MIYVLEDDNNIRNFVTYALNNSGLECEGFERPGTFWEAVERQGAQIIAGNIFCLENEAIRHNALKTAYLIFSYLMDNE